MTKDDIIRMAREAGGGTTWWPLHTDTLERFANLIASAEREECAKLAEKTICDVHIFTGVSIYGTRAAKAIRARGNA
jgi:hypothetical protein